MSLSERYWSRQDDLITRTAEAASVCAGLSVFVYTVALFHNNAILDPVLPTERGAIESEKKENFRKIKVLLKILLLTARLTLFKQMHQK